MGGMYPPPRFVCGAGADVDCVVQAQGLLSCCPPPQRLHSPTDGTQCGKVECGGEAWCCCYHHWEPRSSHTAIAKRPLSTWQQQGQWQCRAVPPTTAGPAGGAVVQLALDSRQQRQHPAFPPSHIRSQSLFSGVPQATCIVPCSTQALLQLCSLWGVGRRTGMGICPTFAFSKSGHCIFVCLCHVTVPLLINQMKTIYSSLLHLGEGFFEFRIMAESGPEY